MTEQQVARFYEALSTLAEMFDKTLSVKTQELYLAALGDLGLENFQLACTRAAQECKFFPKPVELRELVSGTATEQAGRAWAYLLDALAEGAGQYHSCQVQDGATAVAIARCWGSLIEAHAAMRALAPDEPMYASQRKNFISAYVAALREDVQPRYFAGTVELNNRTISFPRDYVQPVVLLGTKGVARLMMPFSGQTGELTAPARQALEAADKAALRAYLPSKSAPQLIGLPAPQEAVPMPDEVRALLNKGETGRAALRLVGKQEEAA